MGSKKTGKSDNKQISNLTPKNTDIKPPSKLRSILKFLPLFSIHKQQNMQIGISEDVLTTQLLDAREMKAAEIMIPRADIVAIDADISLEKLKEKFVLTGFIRLIVYKKDLDEIMGFVHLRDFFAYLYNNQQPYNHFSVMSILSKAIYAARSTRCFSLFCKMKDEGAGMSVILDEYGGIEGIVSIERLVEKMFGIVPTRKETEQQIQPSIQKISRSSYIIDARTSIQEIEEILGNATFLSEEEGAYETIGGFVLSYLDRIPTTSEKFLHPSGLEIEIIEATARVIKTIKITDNNIM